MCVPDELAPNFFKRAFLEALVHSHLEVGVESIAHPAH